MKDNKISIKDDDYNVPEVSVSYLYERINNLAEFARSVLHLDFPDLSKINPSFGVIAKYCEYVAKVFEEENVGQDKKQDIEYIREVMTDIAEAIVDRDDGMIIDSMCSLDDYIETKSKAANDDHQ